MVFQYIYICKTITSVVLFRLLQILVNKVSSEQQIYYTYSVPTPILWIIKAVDDEVPEF